MGTAKQAMIIEQDRNHARNRYYSQRRKLKQRIRLYADNPRFAAMLKQELEELERRWIERQA